MFKKCITLITLTAFIILTLSCSSTYYLDLDKISEFEGENIENVYAEKMTGEKVSFDKALIKENMISAGTVSIPSEEVMKIEFSQKNRSKGAGVGFLTGLLFGGAIGRLLLGLLAGGISSLGNDEDALQGTLYGTGIGGGIGGILGATIGANVGVSDNYTLTAPLDLDLKEMDIEGDVIDLIESNNQNLFSGVAGFEYAAFRKLPDQRYSYEIAALSMALGLRNHTIAQQYLFLRPDTLHSIH